MTLAQRRSMIDMDNENISTVRQCYLLDIQHSGYYYEPVKESQLNQTLMRLIDLKYTQRPYFGAKRMCCYLGKLGYFVNVKRVRRLMRLMDLIAIYPKKQTTIIDSKSKKYPYLLRNILVVFHLIFSEILS